MPVGVPVYRNWTVSDLQTAALFNSQIRDAGIFGTNPPIFLGTQAAAQSVANSTFAPLVLDTNVIDTYSGHSTVTNNSRYTAQVAGVYRVVGRASFLTNGTGRRLIKITKNAADMYGTQSEYFASTTATALSTVQTEYWLTMAVGDFCEINVFQTSGGALSLSAASPAGSSMFAQWIHA